MWITFSLFVQYSYVLASVRCENLSHNDKSCPTIPNMPGSIGQKWFRLWPRHNLGSPRTISDIWITICFTINVTNKRFGNKKRILVFLFCFSIALAQNTTVVTTATTMAAAGETGPLAPHMRPCALRRRVKWMGNNPPSLRMYFLGGLRVFMALKVLPAMMHCHKIGVFWWPCTPQQPKKLYPLARGVIAHPFNASARSKRSCVGR